MWNETLPSNDAAEDAMLTMQHLIPHVQRNLPHALGPWAGSYNSHVAKEFLHEVQPQASVDQGELTSFKAPWETEKCLQAVATTGLYEAAVDVLWLQARKLTQVPFGLPLHTPSWSTVREMYERQVSKEAGGLGGVTSTSSPRLYSPSVSSCVCVRPSDSKIRVFQ